MHTPAVTRAQYGVPETRAEWVRPVSDATQPPEEGELREGDGVQRVVLPLLLLLPAGRAHALGHEAGREAAAAW